MQINPMRIANDIDAIASFTEADPAFGHSRPTFTPAWQQARDYIITQAEAAGCTARIDPAGNTHIRHKNTPWEKQVWLSGSHIDSVPTGGKFDGVVGVVAPLEVLRTSPTAPLELIIFAEEEGTTFNLGMLGSRAWTGSLTIEQLRAVKNRDGLDYLTAGQPHGVDPQKLATDHFNPAHYKGLIELHVEQGPAMWNKNIPVAVVTAINGRLQSACTVTGAANHAGSTKMSDRHDALAAAAEMILAAESIANELQQRSDHTVATVGRITVEPNAINVIAGKTSFTIDFRARTNEILSYGTGMFAQQLHAIAHRRRVTLDFQTTEGLPPMPMDPALCGLLRQSAKRLNTPLPEVASGALHDAAILAPHLPTAMLFIASEAGISHNPKEFSRIEDIALATLILAETVQS